MASLQVLPYIPHLINASQLFSKFVTFLPLPLSCLISMSSQTPNPILGRGDVPVRHNQIIVPDVTYPAGSRYTLQWLKPTEEVLLFLLNNVDATFKRSTRQSNLPTSYSTITTALQP